ncbi:bactoprenol glucosyl transferase [Dethiosulfatarculus sandiegensis]|uniref:Bactoprenol glucosyl transferase n=1 Tax=Dethiosulfatarculus sandiegensis TaxID=1429043 RepID=A0A0D2HZF5_9BACT|nr:bactoprenol glucosyl transferase [Dethiosulfatarculus sandiegensis]
MSIIIPVFNEELCIERFLNDILSYLEESNISCEVIVVDDGSCDNSLNIITEMAVEESRLKIISLSKNFGKEAALTAGYDHCSGDLAICMDSDGQHPLSIIPVMLEKWSEGYDVVIAASEGRKDKSRIKKYLSKYFSNAISKISNSSIPAGASDFSLLDKKAVLAIQGLKEQNRYMKGIVSWIGYKSIIVKYTPEVRQNGETKFSLFKLLELAVNGIVGFSTLPLRLWFYLGLSIAMPSLLYALYLIIRTLILGRDVPGYASLMVSLLFFGGVQLIAIGVIGEYVGKILIETKKRPLYLIKYIDLKKSK